MNPEDMLKETSRSFYIPTMNLPERLRDAVMSSYLCLRAIDEIEDHPRLPANRKAALLNTVSELLQGPFGPQDFAELLGQPADDLPAVTVRIYDWLILCPSDIAPRVWDATASMSARMATWSVKEKPVQAKADLDRYCFAVAGSVGLLLSDLWAWFDGTKSDRVGALAFGRGLQSLNILRDQHADHLHGRSFVPSGWGNEQLLEYSVGNLVQADEYVDALPSGPGRSFCATALAFAWAGLEEATGGPRLTRERIQELAAHAQEHGTIPDHSRVLSAVAAMSG
jgi:farnesyl-diphosphate farnesyltransferase